MKRKFEEGDFASPTTDWKCQRIRAWEMSEANTNNKKSLFYLFPFEIIVSILEWCDTANRAAATCQLFYDAYLKLRSMKKIQNLMENPWKHNPSVCYKVRLGAVYGIFEHRCIWMIGGMPREPTMHIVKPFHYSIQKPIPRGHEYVWGEKQSSSLVKINLGFGVHWVDIEKGEFVPPYEGPSAQNRIFYDYSVELSTKGVMVYSRMEKKYIMDIPAEAIDTQFFITVDDLNGNVSLDRTCVIIQGIERNEWLIIKMSPTLEYRFLGNQNRKLAVIGWDDIYFERKHVDSNVYRLSLSTKSYSEDKRVGLGSDVAEEDRIQFEIPQYTQDGFPKILETISVVASPFHSAFLLQAATDTGSSVFLGYFIPGTNRAKIVRHLAALGPRKAELEMFTRGYKIGYPMYNVQDQYIFCM